MYKPCLFLSRMVPQGNLSMRQNIVIMLVMKESAGKVVTVELWVSI